MLMHGSTQNGYVSDFDKNIWSIEHFDDWGHFVILCVETCCWHCRPPTLFIYFRFENCIPFHIIFCSNGDLFPYDKQELPKAGSNWKAIHIINWVNINLMIYFMLISIPCHIFCSGKRLPIPAARPYLSVYSKCPPPPQDWTSTALVHIFTSTARSQWKWKCLFPL